MNNENNINGIPNVNDIKIEDTPAESFANIYGNGGQPQQPTPVQQPVPPVQPTPVQQPVPPVQPTPVQQPVPPVQPTPVQQPVPPAQPTPAPQPVPSVQPVQVDADRLQSIEEQLSKTSQYKPEDFQEEKIDIPTTNEYEKNKSGLSFVIAISIIILLFLIALPFVTKFFS